jgi:hypothetical protein
LSTVPKTDDYINAMLSAGVELRLNDMSDRVELSNGKPLNDIQAAAILNRLRDYDMKDTARMRDAIKEAALRNKYHPIREYLDSLIWDGAEATSTLANEADHEQPGGDGVLAQVPYRLHRQGARRATELHACLTRRSAER